MKNTRRLIALLIYGIMFFVMSMGASVFANENELDQNILSNPSFEQLEEGIPASWGAKDNWGSGSVTTTPEAARSGDVGVKMQTDVTTDYWIRQTVDVEGGELYELSAWLKSDVPESMYHGRAVMKVEFYLDTADADGWRGQDTGTGYYESIDEWEFKNMYVEVPEDANMVQVYLRLYGPGEVYFDDASFHKIDQIPGLNIETDRVFYYEEIEEGMITGTIGIDDGTFDDLTLDLNMYPENGGDPIVQESGLPATEYLDFPFDLTNMALQEPYIVEVTLKSAVGEVLLEDTETIYRWERPTALREDGVLIVDGEPFFPMLGYHVIGYGIPEEDFPNVRKTVNTLQGDTAQLNLSTAKYQLDLAHEHDFKVFLPLYPNVWDVEGSRGYQYVVDMVTEFKDHPAVIGWMIQDEPNKFETQGHPNIHEVIAETYRLIRSIDPVNPSYMVINDIDGFDTFGRLTDIVVTDPYPLLRDPITMVRDHVREAKELNPEKTVWNVLQAFHLPGNSRYPYLPNMTELRNMIYQSMIEGAQGLGYYSFIDPGWDLMESELYPGIVEFTEKELPHFEEIVLYGEQVESRQDESTQWSLWELEDELYAAVVNVTEDPQTAVVTLPQSGYHIETLAPKHGQSSTEGNELVLDMFGLESSLIKLTPFTAADELEGMIEHFENEGQIVNRVVARALTVHLMALEHFENQGDINKVLQHMGGFQVLLDQHHGNDLILEEAYDALTNGRQALTKQFIETLLHMDVQLDDVKRVTGELIRLQIQLKNRSEEMVHAPTVTVRWPEELGMDPVETTVSDLNPGQSQQEVIEIEVPESVPVGSVSLMTEVAFNYHGEQVGYSRENRLDILPVLETPTDTKQLQLSRAGDYPATFILTNNASQPVVVQFEEDSSNMVSVDMGSVQVEAGQTMEIEGVLHIPNSLAEGEYDATIHALVNGRNVMDLSFDINLNYNFLQNPGFEQLIGDNPVGWDPNVSWDSGFVTPSSEASRTGNIGIKINSDTTNEYRVRQRVPIKGLEGARTFELSAWLKSDIRSSQGRAQMKVEFYNDTPDANGFVGDAWSEEFGTYEEWENIKMQFELPEEANIVSVLLRLYGPGTAYYDDVSLELIEEEDVSNLVINPGFEEGDSTPDHWWIQSTANWEWVQDEVHSGQYAVTLYPGPRGSSDINTIGNIPVTPGKTYRVTYWAKNSSTNGGSFGIRNVNANNTTIDYIWTDVQRDVDWTEHTIEFVPEEGTVSVGVYLRLEEGVNGQIWFDDVRIEEVKE